MAAKKSHFIANIPPGIHSQKHYHRTPFNASELSSEQSDMCIILHSYMVFIGIPTFIGLFFINSDLFSKNYDFTVFFQGMISTFGHIFSNMYAFK